MPVSAQIFLGIILLIFTILDIWMIVSLLKPGDERKRMIVWKAGTYTLLVYVGASVIDIIENLVRGLEMTVNPLLQLELIAIVYFIAILFFRIKHGG